MPSHRMIDPAFWRSETVAALAIARRYFFIGLLSNADDQGRLRAHPALLRAQIYPFDDISLDQIREALAELAGGGFISLYSADGKDYLQIPNWWKYQRPRWARPSDHPPPEGWADRIRYRRGNTVIQDNWDGAAEAPASDPAEDEVAVGPQPKEPEVAADPSLTHCGPILGPQWAHGGLAPGPAPSNRGRGRDRDSDRNRGRDSGSNRGSSSGSGSGSGSGQSGPRPPPTAVVAGPKRNILALHAILAARGVGEPTQTRLVGVIWLQITWLRPGARSRKRENGQKNRKDSGLRRPVWTMRGACGILARGADGGQT